MENNSKTNTILLIIVIILLGVLIFSNEKMQGVLGYKGVEQQPIEKSISLDPYVPPTEKKEVPKKQQDSVLQTIFNQYKNGIIEECRDNGQVYYSASHNGYDGGGETFDSNGKVVGVYHGYNGQYTGIVPKNCTQIYVVSPNIWRYTPINTYNLK